jgi:non-ribosomal peptide synthetase component F
VAIAHRTAATMVAWALGFFHESELAATLAATSVSFDLSVFEIFATLAAVGCLVLVRDALGLPAAAARGEVPPVTLVNTVPSAMTELVARGGVPPSVRTVNLAGEALPRALVDAIHRETSATRVNNLYGPSEDTTYSTGGAIRPTGALRSGDPEAPEIGRPVEGTRAYLVDRRGRPVFPGTPGELWLAGAGVTRG